MVGRRPFKIINYRGGKKKENTFALEQAMKAQKGSRGTAPLF
jgi:hypothetical protein